MSKSKTIAGLGVAFFVVMIIVVVPMFFSASDSIKEEEPLLVPPSLNDLYSPHNELQINVKVNADKDTLYVCEEYITSRDRDAKKLTYWSDVKSYRTRATALRYVAAIRELQKAEKSSEFDKTVEIIK